MCLRAGDITIEDSTAYYSYRGKGGGDVAESVDEGHALHGREGASEDLVNGFRGDSQSLCPAFESQPARHLSLASTCWLRGNPSLMRSSVLG